MKRLKEKRQNESFLRWMIIEWMSRISKGDAFPLSWRHALSKPLTFYSLSQLSIFCCGLHLIYINDFYSILFGIDFLCCTLLSYLADVKYICLPTMIHKVDVCFATKNMILANSMLLYSYFYSSENLIPTFLMMGLSISFRLLSWYSVYVKDLASYFICHALWHYFIGGTSIVFFHTTQCFFFPSTCVIDKEDGSHLPSSR